MTECHKTPATITGQKPERPRRAGWTRRQTLATLSASIAMLPLASTAQPLLPPALAEICLKAVASPFAARLGEAAAQGRQVAELSENLLARLGPMPGPDWSAALCQSARRDIAGGDMVEVLGRPVMRTEAETLALGALLLQTRAASGPLT